MYQNHSYRTQNTVHSFFSSSVSLEYQEEIANCSSEPSTTGLEEMREIEPLSFYDGYHKKRVLIDYFNFFYLAV